MIVRNWEGRVLRLKSPEYLRLMREVVLPDYHSAPGNRGAWCLHRREEDVVHLRIVSHWESWDAIRAYAGADMDRPRSYYFDKDFLLELHRKVEHWEMQDGRSASAGGPLTRGG